MNTFSSSLERSAVVWLNELGYAYQGLLDADHPTYWLSRDLSETIQAVVSFQERHYHDDSSDFGFTVNLGRHSPIAQRLAYPGAGLMIRLPNLIWEYYGLRLYSKPDYWWDYNDAEQLERALGDAHARLQRYGLSWLENPTSGRVVPVSRSDWSIFYDAVFEVLSPGLAAIGYYRQQDSRQKWHPARARPSFYFAKEGQGGSHTYILFHPLQFAVPDLGEIQGFVDLTRTLQPLLFDLICIRNDSTDPYADCTSSHITRREYWLSRITKDPSSEQPGPLETNLWKYTTREELVFKLRDALDQAKQIGIPGIENPEPE